LAVVPIEEVKRMIELQVPMHLQKSKSPSKKSATKKAAPKKAAKKKYKTKIPFNFEWDFL
jgi:hypothetical protein